MTGWLIGYGVILLLCLIWSGYEVRNAPTDKELWGEQIE